PGQEGGLAIADVLFGDYNPAGRLPISMAKSVGQLPVHYNHTKPKHHDYIEFDAKPLYAFGHGLSYTQFAYNNLQVDVQEGDDDFVCKVQFEVKNIGEKDGEEVAQLYIVDEVSSVVTPVKQLKGFAREFIKKGETKVFSFELTKADLKLWGTDRKWKTEKGGFKLLVGPSSDSTPLSDRFELMQDYKF